MLGNHTGTDGLTVADFPELKVERGRMAFEKVPAIVRVRATSSKAGHANTVHPVVNRFRNHRRRRVP